MRSRRDAADGRAARVRPGEPATAADGDVDSICGVVRQAAELGADIIKADPTDDTSDYHRVVTVARVPLLVRGGGRVTDQEILERTHAVLEQGAAGIVYGRNVIQHANPAAMTQALMASCTRARRPSRRSSRRWRERRPSASASSAAG